MSEVSKWKLRYTEALDEEVRRLLAKLVAVYYRFLDRPGVEIRTVFAPDDLVVNGRASPGKTVLASTREHELHGIGAWLYFSWEWWSQATTEQREALLDHLLAHLWYDTEHERLCLLRPDLQEFAAVWQRRGDWNDRLKRASRILQGKLPGLEAESETPPQDREIPAAPGVPPGPVVQRVVCDLCPRPGDGVESVTIMGGGHEVTLTAETRRKIDRMLAWEQR